MKKYLVIILIIMAAQLNAQDKQEKFDIKFGIGISLLGTGDMTTINFENELNYKYNHHFSTSFTLNYGRSNSGVYMTSSYIQGNLNIYISPFKNNRKNNFRIGTGLSIMNISDSHCIEQECGVGIKQSSPCHYNRRNSFGLNIIIEDTYSINDRFLIGLKLFTQPYSNGDINSGLLIKCGLKL